MKVKLFNLSVHLICIGILITPYIWRIELLNSQVGLFNLFSWLGVVLMLYELQVTSKYSLQKTNINFSIICVLCLAAIFILNITFVDEIEMLAMFKYVYATILPLVVLFVNIPKEKFMMFYFVFCNYLIFSSFVIVLCGVLDYTLNLGIGNVIANTTQIESLLGMVSSGRMVSYVGHPLYSSQILLFCFAFNSMKYQYFIKEKNNFKILLITIICFIGIALAGSKTGIVIISILFALLFLNKQRIKITIIILAVVYFLWSLGIFDPILERFASGIASGDLSTGRNTSLVLLFVTGELSFKLFEGHSNTGWSTQLIAALEYPILKWAYVFGIWFSAIVSVWVFVIPIVKSIIKKQKTIFLVLLFLILQVNSYNGLSVFSDHMLLYCISIMLVMNLLNKISEENA